jgi:hypothetical protein
MKIAIVPAPMRQPAAECAGRRPGIDHRLGAFGIKE